MNCGDFWFWFTRPFAEFLGAAALFACLVIPFGLFVWFLNRQATRKPRHD